MTSPQARSLSPSLSSRKYGPDPLGKPPRDVARQPLSEEKHPRSFPPEAQEAKGLQDQLSLSGIVPGQQPSVPAGRRWCVGVNGQATARPANQAQGPRGLGSEPATQQLPGIMSRGPQAEVLFTDQ